jgi:hypothetical protein
MPSMDEIESGRIDREVAKYRDSKECEPVKKSAKTRTRTIIKIKKDVEITEENTYKLYMIKNKPLQMLKLLLDGGEIKLESGHTLKGNESIIGYVFTKQVGNEPTEEIILPCEWTINEFIRFAENYDNGKFWRAMANQTLIKEKSK